MIALTGHLPSQAPHLMQVVGLISCRPFISPLMASTGQTFLQRPQPMHLSVTINPTIAVHAPAGQR